MAAGQWRAAAFSAAQDIRDESFYGAHSVFLLLLPRFILLAGVPRGTGKNEVRGADSALRNGRYDGAGVVEEKRSPPACTAQSFVVIVRSGSPFWLRCAAETSRFYGNSIGFVDYDGRWSPQKERSARDQWFLPQVPSSTPHSQRGVVGSHPSVARNARSVSAALRQT